MEDASKREILEAIGTFAEQVDRRFERIESEMGSMKSEIGAIKSQMVTKSYLDDKLGDLKGDMVEFVRREDQKIIDRFSRGVV